MLSRDLLLNLAPSACGVVRVNHETKTCRGDSKSLRIELKEDGSIHGKCFRCGEWGITDVKKSFFPPEAKEILVPPEEFVPLNTSPKGWAWVYSYDLSPEDIKTNGIEYDPYAKRVIIPFFWTFGEKLGYQARKIYDEDTGPKYITYSKTPYGNVVWGPNKTNEIVLVEDVISSIKVGKVTNSLAMLSTNPHPMAKDFLTQFDKFYIWLDMDNPQVIRQALKLLKKLRILGETKLISTPKDPKYYSKDDIERILYGT